MPTYSTKIETPSPGLAGSLEAFTFESPEIGPDHPVTLIRTDQKWGITVNWELDGPNAAIVNGEFRVRAFLERMGVGTDLALPMNAPKPYLTVNAYSNWTADPHDPNMHLYHVDISAPDTVPFVPPGVYKITTLVQLYTGQEPLGTPMAVAGFVELPMIEIYAPS